jgi:hypothetical protein
MSFLNADPFKERPENWVEGEGIQNIQVNQAVYLQHNVFFGDSVILYTDLNDKQGSLLVKDADYGFDDQDTIATEQSNSLCYKRLVFYKVFAQVYADYWAYGDLVTADIINQMAEDALDALQKAIQNAHSIAAHIAQYDAHGATQDAAANTMALRNSRGTFSIGEPQLAAEPARKQELDSEAAARQNADAAELAAREAQDLELSDRIAALSGAVAYLQAKNFGNPDGYPVDTDTTIDPPAYNWQDTLSNYAAAEHPEWQTTDPNTGNVAITVPNSVAVKNLWNNHVWIYSTETSLWTDNGQGNVSAFTNQLAGIIQGDEDTFGAVKANPDGIGSVNGLVGDGDGSKVLKDDGTYGELSKLSAASADGDKTTITVNDDGTVAVERPDGSVENVALMSDLENIIPGEGLAPLESPTFTGTPTAPTPASSAASTQVATAAWVRSYVDGSGRNKGYRPIGDVYFRLPGMAAPGDLFVGTWTDVSNLYPGCFFRVKGGNAAAFGGGAQGDAMREISGYVDAVMNFGAAGGAFGLGNYARGEQNSNTNNGNHRFDFTNARVTAVAAENRPLNYSIEIYKRTA